MKLRSIFTYTADAPSGGLPSGEVTTGDPIFLRLVDSLDLAVTYELDGAGGTVEPGGRLWIELANGSGWSTRSPLGDQHVGDAGTLLLEGTLDLPQSCRTLERVQEQTGVGAGGATITVTAQIEIAGSVAGEPVSDRFRPHEGDGDGADTNRGVARSQVGSVLLPDDEPARLELLGREINVVAVRAVGLTVLALALLRRGRAPARPRRGQPGPAALWASDHRGGGARDPGRLRVVDVREVADLVTLADRIDSPVLRHRSATVDTYPVEGDAAVYRYQIGVQLHEGSGPGE